MRLISAEPSVNGGSHSTDPGGDVLGFAKLNWDSPNPITRATGAELRKIYFRASAVGKGYGSDLLEYIVKHVTERGDSRLWLDVLKSNTGAQRFYQRHCFRRFGEVPFSTDRGEIGIVVMQRDLQRPRW